MAQLNLILFDLLTVPRGLLFFVIKALFCIKSKENWINIVSKKSRQNGDACMPFVNMEVTLKLL